MKVVLTVIILFFNCLLFGQIHFDSTKISLSRYNNKTCVNFTYDAELPVFSDSTDFLKVVNDAVYGFCKNYFDEQGPDSFPGREDALALNDCSTYLYNNYPSVIKITYTFLSLSDTLLSFYLTASRVEGQGGNGSDEAIIAFNLNPAKGVFIDWRKELDTALYSKAVELINKEDGTDIEMNEDGSLPGNISDVCLSANTARFFYESHSGSHSWYRYVDVPLEKKETGKKRKKIKSHKFKLDKKRS